MIENHKFTSLEKIAFFGYGEWVEEPDEVAFTYKGFDCEVRRVVIREPCESFHMFGGHLCGYVRIPPDHPYYHKKYEDMDIDCYGDLTFSECSDEHWIGFDCAHFLDFVPSIEKARKELHLRIEEKFNLNDMAIFRKTYKNIYFCIKECKAIVEQLYSIRKVSNLSEA